MHKYLNKEGLSYFHSRLKNRIIDLQDKSLQNKLNNIKASVKLEKITLPWYVYDIMFNIQRNQDETETVLNAIKEHCPEVNWTVTRQASGTSRSIYLIYGEGDIKYNIESGGTVAFWAFGSGSISDSRNNITEETRYKWIPSNYGVSFLECIQDLYNRINLIQA